LEYTIKIIHCATLAITNPVVVPTIPYIGVKITTNPMNIDAKIILVITRILLFSFPKIFEVKSNVIVDGITAKLII
jgi:hypothetical protein